MDFVDDQEKVNRVYQDLKLKYPNGGNTKVSSAYGNKVNDDDRDCEEEEEEEWYLLNIEIYAQTLFCNSTMLSQSMRTRYVQVTWS